MAINTHEYPSLDYQLNVCLVNLAMEITDENLHIMKYLLTGNASFHVVLEPMLSITHHICMYVKNESLQSNLLTANLCYIEIEFLTITHLLCKIRTSVLKIDIYIDVH